MAKNRIGAVAGVALAAGLLVMSAPTSGWSQPVGADAPPARLIKPRANRAEPHPPETARRRAGPVDESCRELKQELETALRQKQPRQRRGFQAQLAHNAGTRLCREGQADKGMAEFRKGLSYFDR
jgi:hypothetical protein